MSVNVIYLLEIIDVEYRDPVIGKIIFAQFLDFSQEIVTILKPGKLVKHSNMFKLLFGKLY